MAIVVEQPCPMCGQSIDSTARGCRHCGERFDVKQPTDEDLDRREARERFQAHQAEGLYSIPLIGILTLLCMPICYYVPILRTVWGWGVICLGGTPICAVYGAVFLYYYQEPYPLRWKAVAGTILNWILSALVVAGFVWTISSNG